MSFNSIEYLIFLPAVLLVYWLLPHRDQNILLLGASYLFLGYIHPWFLGLIFTITLTNYLCALHMARRPALHKPLMVSAAVISLGVLGVFKYADFFLSNVAALLSALGLESFTYTLDILLPVGISFYTFQALAYTIDVYRGDLAPRSNLLHVALFISFFPQLVAGPIERAGHLLPQVETRRQVTPQGINQGLMLLVWGFFKKLVIADNAGLIAYKVFALPEPSFPVLWAGVWAFAIQILADFWSYTDIARGSARLLGFTLSRNFDHPYLARSPADFWRRWHMSLSYWLRDYVYIPLGGSKCSAGRSALNIMATFLLSGLWHGASWNFVLWGGYHGALILAERMLRNVAGWIGINGGGRAAGLLRMIKIVGTFGLVCVGWLMFRETDFPRLLSLATLDPGAASTEDWQVAAYLAILVLFYSLPIWIHGAIYTWDKRRRGPQPEYGRNLLLARPVAASLLFLGILVLKSPEPATFIYFQF
ncbi:MAG: MBOAT family O-acyltransferase [Desulfobacterales bacterium]